MKFSWKVFLCTIIILAAGLCFGGVYLINSMFKSALDRDIKQALDESSLLRFAFETAVANYPAKYERLQDATIEQICMSLASGDSKNSRLIRIKEQENILYQSNGLEDILLDYLAPKENSKIYTLVNTDDNYYIRIITTLSGFDRNLNLETIKNISSVFDERKNNFSVYRQVSMIVLMIEALITFILAVWLTRPVKRLSIAAKNMADGNYSYRAQIISNDELGALTDDFNKMAEALEEKILLLQEEARMREDFVAAFAHELKTPLTAIIGYADVLRVRKLDEEKHFLSADYIYREGKRLETLYFRLLELVVLKRSNVNLAPTVTSSIFQYIIQSFENEDLRLIVSFDDVEILVEEALIKTLLLNLVDNAIKASYSGRHIEVSGKLLETGYLFSVEDFGCGIAEDEFPKITEAFYMVDRSRSRSRNGAGLGLALCNEILALHKSKLKFESTLGMGTKVSFVVRRVYEP